MFTKLYYKNLEYFIYILPLSIVLSNFVTNFIVYYVAIFGFYQILFKKKTNIIKNKYCYLFIVFCLYIILRSFFVSEGNILFSLKSSLTLIRYLFFFVAIVIIIERNTKFIINFLKCISLILFFVFLDSSVQFFTGENLVGHSDDSINRISGLFKGRYVLGSYISKLVILYLFLLNFKYPFKNFKILYLFIVFTSTFVILISGDRSALGIFFIGIFLLLFLLDNNYLKLKEKMLILVTIFVFLSSFLTFSEKIKSRFIGQTLNDIRSAENFFYFSKGHESHFKTSFKMYENNLIFGKGPNMFRKYCDHKDYNSGPKSCSTHPHNYYFQLLGETGILGFLIFCSAYFLICLRLAKQFYLINFKDANYLNLNELIVSVIYISNFWPVITTGNIFSSFTLNLIVLPMCFVICEKKHVY